MGKLLKWLIDKQVRLIQHFNEKQPACTPSNEWWILVGVIYPLVERVESTFCAVQEMNTLVCEQRAQLTKLVHDMQMRQNVEGPMNADGRARLFPATEEEQIAVDRFFFRQLLRHS